MSTKLLHPLHRAKAELGIRQSIQQGRVLSNAPLGYRNCGKGKVKIDWEVAPLVRDSFLLTAEASSSLRDLLAQMTVKGLRTRSGKEMSIASFWSLLTNPFYVGFVSYQKKLYPGSHQALIDPDTFSRVQTRLVSRRRKGKDDELLASLM